MISPRIALALALCTGIAGASGCYSERLPPPTFRFSCAADSDCNDPEQCIGGLCQVACTQATFDDDCGEAAGNFVACFNGVCTSVCDLDDPVCSNPQECVGFEGIDLSSLGGGGLFGGGGGGGNLGLCAVQCETGTCPEGEVCVVGACTQSCDPAAANTCTGGLVCSPEGVCLPDFGGSSTDTDSATGTDTGGGSASTTTDGGSSTTDDSTSSGTDGGTQ